MLTLEEKKEITRLYDLTCKAFDKNLERDVLKMQVEDLEDLNFNDIHNALIQYRRDSRNQFWPKANKIRELINPKMSIDAQSVAIATKIREGITTYGWANLRAANANLGEMAWVVVERLGGWQYICENHGLNLNPGTFHAQARDVAKSLLESNSIKQIEHVALNKPNNDVLTALDFKIKELPK